MGHVLGLVNGQNLPCHCDCDSDRFEYGWCKSGSTPLATIEYNNLGLTGNTLRVENDGSSGTRCGHWEEDSFDKSTGSSELMTGYFESNLAQPITRVSVASLDECLADYTVNYDAADAFPYNPSDRRGRGLSSNSTSTVFIPDETFDLRGRMIDLPPPLGIGPEGEIITSP